ncbi:MAG: Na+/H+ antiporter-like protein [candidate division TM6 bacterium GW2011_GWE2_41_16]|nr:MAG: Na+/H+ antiporter-like protein [candidate division TM6 bacterium GW2011_GWE2_41_16]
MFSGELSFIVLVPTIIVIVCAVLTHKVRLALAFGVVSAAGIAAHGHLWKTCEIILHALYGTITDSCRVYTFGLLICLGIFIRLIIHSGGIKAYAKRMVHYIKTPRAAELTTLSIAPLFFLDEYFSNLTIGCVMNPIFDFFRHTRVKLAYLLNSVGAPWCVLIPASSWTAFLLATFNKNGINTTTDSIINSSPFMLYIILIPCMIYPIVSVFSAWFISARSISFGPMRTLEQAHNEAKAPQSDECNNSHAATSNFFVPFGVFMGSLIILLAGTYSGIIPTPADTQTLFSLLCASIIAALFTMGMFWIKKVFSHKEILYESWIGAKEMFPPVILLLLAWMFGNIVDAQLHAGTYVAQLVSHSFALWLLPCVLFIVAMLISASIGSAWGTLLLLIPFVINIFSTQATIALSVSQIPLILPMLGAVLSGSVAGGHLSPFHDLVVLAATSTKVPVFEHLKTQIVYSIPAIIATFVGFLSIGLMLKLGYTPVISLSLGLGEAIILCGIILTVVNWWSHRK